MNSTSKVSKLRQARIARGFTLAQLAQLVGISHPTLSNYEKGTSVPSPAIFRKIQRVLNIDNAYNEFFSHAKHTGRRKKYKTGEKCKYDGCSKPPEANGLCMNHYVSIWKKKKRIETNRLLHNAWQALAEAQKERVPK